MSGRSVTVLAPNGRRQIVKCSLNTTILHILEEVCLKQGFNPQEYDIKHHNKAMDTTQTVQFSGLPNNAQLELSPANKARVETEVTVALNLENGTRVFGTFAPTNTLHDVLVSLYSNYEPNPVIIYMRREIYGDDLKETDLRSLGLTGGRAMFRLINRSPEELRTQANVSSSIQSKPIEEKPYKRVFQPIINDNELPPKTDITLPTPNNNDSVQPDILKLPQDERKSEDLSCLNKSISSSEYSMEFDKKKFVSKEERELDKTNVFSSQNSICSEQSVNDYINCVKMEDFPFIGDRKCLIFPLDSNNVSFEKDPPDDFFNLTLDDAKVILRDIRKKCKEVEEGGPLLTAALRELEQSKKQLRQLNKYTKSIIRVLFPDRTVLQAVFSPTDLVQTVIEFVASHLENSDMSFYLYSTPPKFILPNNKRLIEVDCVPGALLHFGADDQYKNGNFLKNDLKVKYTTNSMASLAAFKIREETKRNNEKEINSAIPGCSKDANNHCDNQDKKKLCTSDQMPKWFKGT